MKFNHDSNEVVVVIKMKRLLGRHLYVHNLNNNSNANGNNNLDNNGRFLLIAQNTKMQNQLYHQLCSFENLFFAYKRARKRKTQKPYVFEFEKDLISNLLQLRFELLTNTYKPKSLRKFIIKDPKTRTIHSSAFRDRIVHHALCNIIEPVFDKTFIYDSYANRKGKGVLKAIKRFDYFKKKVNNNNAINAFVLKADIKHYFETVDHKILMGIIKNKVNDGKVLQLIKTILVNYSGGGARAKRYALRKLNVPILC